MRVLPPLPTDLPAHFSVAHALECGVLPSRLRGRDLEHPFHGVRSRPFAGAEDFDEYGEAARAHLRSAFAYAPLLKPGQFFSHVTAAVILGIPIPYGLCADAEVHVSVFPPARLPRAQGVRGHEARVALTHVTVDAASGLPVTTPASTWAALAGMLVDVRDVVAAGDGAVREWRVEPLTTLSQLAAAVEAGRRVGVGLLREALPLIRTRSASRPETRTRLEIVFAALPEPELNVAVFDDDGYVGAVDLAYPELRIAIEYEGEHHLLSPVQWERDIERYARLEAAGWIVIRVTKTMLFARPEELVAKVRRARAARA